MNPLPTPQRWFAAVALIATFGCDATGTPRPGAAAGQVDSARLANASREPEQWLATGGGPEAQFYSRLDQITADNADRLGFAWEFTARSPRGRVQHGMQATGLVVDGMMYVSGPWSMVYALDARTGAQRWRYDPKVDGSIARRSCCGVSNRGVQVWRGKVYVATLDGYLVALDAATGQVVWRTDTFVERDRDYTITGAPQIAGTNIVIGNSGADFGVRGYISAYNLESGALAWRFFTVPRRPDQPQEHPELDAAVATWDPKAAWEAGLGGTVWGLMAYDSALDLLYLGTGNSSPYPIWFRSPSGGDNLYLASIVAIKAATGRMAWYYQTVPGEIWDYTVSSNLVLADLPIGGRTRSVVMTAPKNGFYYVLDRATGELLAAEKYVRVNWATRVDSVTKRPVVDSAAAWYQRDAKLVFPSSYGGHNWMPMSFSPKLGLAFIPTIERGMIFQSQPEFSFRNHHVYQGVVLDVAPETVSRLTGGDLSLLETKEFLKAWDPVAGRERWRTPLPGEFNGGVLSTASDLVVHGQADGQLIVRRAADGSVVKAIPTGTAIMAAPMTYAVGGVQYIAVMAGYGGGIGARFYPGAAGYQYENYPRIIALKLDGSAVPLPPERVEPAVVAPPPIETDPASVRRGGRLFVQHCSYCHAAAPGIVSAYPDLARLPAATHEQFQAIVLAGALRDAGMASFADVLSEEDAAAIHAYLLAEQRKLYESRPSRAP